MNDRQDQGQKGWTGRYVDTQRVAGSFAVDLEILPPHDPAVPSPSNDPLATP